MRLQPCESSISLRIPLPGRVPFQVNESRSELSVTLYGVAANTDWIQYGGTDSLVDLVSFAQPTEDETVVTVSLTQAVWGYRTRWDGTDLILEIRRPPQIDPRRPLAGRVIAIDPGHPPGGARGPTGLWEPDVVVLPIALKTAQLLEQYGARVVLTRDNGCCGRIVGASANGRAVGCGIVGLDSRQCITRWREPIREQRH